MGNSVLGELPPAGSPQVQQQVRHQYVAVFDQRLDGMLRDFEIGFTGGRNVALPVAQQPETSGPDQNKTSTISDTEIRGRLLSHLYDFRHRNGGLVPVSDTVFAGLAPVGDDVIAGVCRLLADAGLIEWTAFLSGPIVGRGENQGFRN
jgi:hypothetical protein